MVGARPAFGALAVAASLSGLAGPAAALSCMRPDALMLYREARDSPHLYRMVLGRIEPLATVALPEPARAPGEERPAHTPARLTGMQLGPGGFAYPHDAEVILELTCLSVWCAGPPGDGKDLLIIARVAGEDVADDTPPVVSLGPCPFNALPAEAAGIAAVEACHRGGDCGDG